MTTRLDTLVWQGTDIDATIIERNLSALWTDLCHRSEFRSAVRMHVFNLVVYVRDETMLNLVSDSLRKIPRRLPSRAIILTGDRFHPTSTIDGEIHLACQGDSPSGQPLCHEQVIVRARGRAADHLASVVIPLLIPELRTYLWWPGQPPFGHRMLHRLLSVVDQFVIDSSEFESPGDGIANLVRLNALQVGINDLNWARLSPWRDVITQFFEGPQWAPYAWGIRKISLEFGKGGAGSRTTAGILLLLGWMAVQLEWEPETGLDGLATEDVTPSGITERRQRAP
jgi:glucose-6-phosphate dehydrogenase assembly protein OpcA